jgi:hypothetical protein
MMFIAYLFFFLVYLAFSIFLVRKAVAAARNRGRKGWKWGLPVAFVMYLIPFWDHVPTLVIHEYLCATEAGLWVYKTPDMWKDKNLAINDSLVANEHTDVSRKNDGEVSAYELNEFFIYENRVEKVPVFPVWIDSALIIDAATSEVLVRQSNVTSGYSGSRVKIWVAARPCVSGAKRFGELMEKFRQIGR